jgi:hypothetical protein
MSALLYVLFGVFAFVGRIFGLVLNGRRELDNKRRELRLHVLVDAWRSIERSANREGREAAERLENALADMQLFGSPSQAQRAAAATRALNESGTQTAALDDLLEELRVDLRAEMRLGRVSAQLVHPRAEAAPQASSRVTVTPRRLRVVPTVVRGGSRTLERVRSE